MPEKDTAHEFTWIPFYTEFAEKLIQYKDNRSELVEKIKQLDESWISFLKARTVNKSFSDVVDIDPFTVFSIFNRSSGVKKRQSIIDKIKELFALNSETPADFDGIPLANAYKSCYYFEDEKNETIPILWELFIALMEGNLLKFVECFDKAQQRKGIKWNITMAFFWMRPSEYMPLDEKSRALLKKVGISVFKDKDLSGNKYLQLLKNIKETNSDAFYVLSKKAFLESEKKEVNGLIVQDNSGSWPDDLIQKMDGDVRPGVFWWHKMPSGKKQTLNLLKQKIDSDDYFEFYIFQNNLAVYKALVMDFVCSQDEYAKKKDAWIENDTQWLAESFDDFHDDKRKAKILFYIEEIEKLEDPIPIEKFVISSGSEKPHMANLVPFKKIIDRIEPRENTMNEEIKQMTRILQLKKNIIFQGAPGTGKTYNTAALALSICDNSVPKTHEEVMRRYDELLKQGQIGFVTFHQSMDYEDFVEGYKPKTDDGQVIYEIEDGIFKTICKNASGIENKEGYSDKIDFKKARIFKMSLGEKGKNDTEIFDYCFENNVVALGWGGVNDFSKCKTREDFRAKDSTWGATAVEIFKEWMQNGDVILISDGTKAVKAIAQIVGDYEYHNDCPIDMCQYRRVKWLYSGESIPISKLYDKNLSQQTIYAFGTRDEKGNVENGTIKIDVLNDIITGNLEKETSQNYVLIIDEINRGNVSKIFGELISLLEADKRSGGNHPLSVTLPYTKKTFSVPSNLYIIGTMNTTDRSVGSIDYAVRRRFAFVTLEADENKVPEGNARNLFNAVKNFLNKSKYDMDIEDLMVGHSYFMDANNLQMKWQYEILPLLMEYHKDGIISKSPLKDDSGNEIADVKKDYAKFVEVWQKKESDSPNP